MSEQQEPRLTTSEEQQQPKEPSAVERFNRAMISGHTISKEADVGISFSAKQLKEHDAAIERKAREDVLNKLTVAVADMGFPIIDKTNEFDDGRACAYGYFMREISKLRGGGCTSCHCLVSDEDVKMEEELRDFPNEGDGY